MVFCTGYEANGREDRGDEIADQLEDYWCVDEGEVGGAWKPIGRKSFMPGILFLGQW